MGINRSSVYYRPAEPSEEAKRKEESIKCRIDYWHTKLPSAGSRKLCRLLQNEGYPIGRKKTRCYMEEMGIYPIYPKPSLSQARKGHKKYPYLLRNKEIFMSNQVWAIDITYIPMKYGHMYLTAIIDWYSRYIVGWSLSDTLDTAPVLEAVKMAIHRYGQPGIINSDQGSQFTSEEYTQYLASKSIRQSMDGKGRWIDNVIIERWFRSLKIEYIYINEYRNPRELREGIAAYVADYNQLRPHQSHAYETPEKLYYGSFVA